MLNKKRAFTLVEVMIVVLVISLIMAIAVPQWMKVRESSQQTTCDENRAKIDQAKTLWTQNTGQDGTATPTEADLVPNYLQLFPKCPTGGIYNIRSGDEDCLCPNHSN